LNTLLRVGVLVLIPSLLCHYSILYTLFGVRYCFVLDNFLQEHFGNSNECCILIFLYIFRKRAIVAIHETNNSELDMSNRAKRLAISEALSSKHPMFRLGAVLENRRNEVASCCNIPAFHGCRGMCAETRLLRHPPRNHSVGGVLYVARVWKDGTLSMARPCNKCMLLIRARGIREINYTNQEGQWVRENID